jgi:phosphate:Na+ symporter
MVDVRGHAQGNHRFTDRGDRKRVTETKRMDDVPIGSIGRSRNTRLPTTRWTMRDHRRLSEIIAFSTNVEHAGDIVKRA